MKKRIETLDEFINERKHTDKFDDYEKYVKEWSDSIIEFLEGKKLGNLPLQDVGREIIEYPSGKKGEMKNQVSFYIEIDELRLNWLITMESGPGEKMRVRIEVSSPNKRGVFEKTVTGRSATNEGIWKTINNIYDGKYKK